MYWYLKALKQYAHFKGRANRKEFWMFFLFQNIFYASFFVIGVSVSYLSSLDDIPMWLQITLIGITWLLSVYIVGTIIPTIAITVRRLHDAGKSGIWFYFPFAVTLLFVVARKFVDIQPLMTGYGVFSIMFGCLLFVFLLQESVNDESESE